MKKLYTMAFTLAAVIGLGSMASAQDQIDKREQRQQNRVGNGNGLAHVFPINRC